VVPVFLVIMRLIVLNLVYYIQQEKIHWPTIRFGIPESIMSRGGLTPNWSDKAKRYDEMRIEFTFSLEYFCFVHIK
jgi:hypothetical protein